MLDALVPLAVALVVWWSSTGAILWLVGRPDTYRRTAMGATALLIAATAALILLRDRTGVLDAYLGFLAGLALWAWHETLFLLGYISGPRRTPCPKDLPMGPRFLAALAAFSRLAAFSGLSEIAGIAELQDYK